LVIVFFIAVLIIFKGPITFLKQESLKKYNWTSNKESIYLPYSKSVMNHLKDIGMQILKQVNDIGVAYATKAFGAENVEKAKDLVQNFSTDKAKTAANDVADYLNGKVQNKLKTIAEKVKSSSDGKPQVYNTSAASSESR
jgi:ribosomal protein S17E